MGELFDKMTSATALYNAFQKCKKDSDWKGSVQFFEMYLLRNIAELQRDLRTFQYRQKPFVQFTLHERGKTRCIKSVHIRDRVVQRALCDEVLVPVLTRSLVYDNGAGTKGKGVSFARDRLQCHLERFVRKHGSNGYVLKIDFSKFFDNIDHEKLFEAVSRKIDDPQMLRLIKYLIATFEIDVSDLSEQEREELKSKPFNSLCFKESDKGQYFLKRSLGIGSQMSQTLGIFFPTPIDTYCKTVKRCKFYGRYMDDIYVIHEDKEFLRSVLQDVRKIADELRLFINEKKTQITPLRCGFTFMQIRYRISETGRISKTLSKSSFSRERRRLKTYKRLLDDERITAKDASNFYQSYKGSTKRFNAHKSIRKLDQIYNSLFLGENHGIDR